MATVYNFDASQGSELSVRLNVKDTNGNAIDLSGYGARGVVKYRYGNTESLVNLSPTIVSGTDGDAWISGLIDIYLSGTQTVDLPVGQFVYDIERYPTGAGANANGAVIKLMKGDFNVYPEVTQPSNV
jgi:hypothetical protein